MIVHFKVVEMEMCLQEVNNAIPAREVICALAEKFRYAEDMVLWLLSTGNFHNCFIKRSNKVLSA